MDVAFVGRRGGRGSDRAGSRDLAMDSSEEMAFGEKETEDSLGGQLQELEDQLKAGQITQKQYDRYIMKLENPDAVINYEPSGYEKSGTEARETAAGHDEDYDEHETEEEIDKEFADDAETAEAVFARIKNNKSLMEDRREYDEEDLASAYQLNDREAKKLYDLIQRGSRAYDAKFEEGKHPRDQGGKFTSGGGGGGGEEEERYSEPPTSNVDDVVDYIKEELGASYVGENIEGSTYQLGDTMIDVNDNGTWQAYSEGVPVKRGTSLESLKTHLGPQGEEAERYTKPPKNRAEDDEPTFTGRRGARGTIKAPARDMDDYSVETKKNELKQMLRDGIISPQEHDKQLREILPSINFKSAGAVRAKDIEGRRGGRISDRAGSRDMPAHDEAMDASGWMEVRNDIYNQLQVGKTYMLDGRKGKVIEKSQGSGQKSAAGWESGKPMVRVEWKDSASDMATDPPESEAQRRAMGAAMGGKSNLGIPKGVGKEMIEADPGGSPPEKKG